jgi:hypothetical protein
MGEEGLSDVCVTEEIRVQLSFPEFRAVETLDKCLSEDLECYLTQYLQ